MQLLMWLLLLSGALLWVWVQLTKAQDQQPPQLQCQAAKLVPMLGQAPRLCEGGSVIFLQGTGKSGVND